MKSCGVRLDNRLKRLAFALRLADVNMLLSQDITLDSRVLLFRHITQRAERLAPFLRFDRDPYLVVGGDGRLYWLQDAYTTSNQYPYAEPTGDLQSAVVVLKATSQPDGCVDRQVKPLLGR